MSWLQGKMLKQTQKVYMNKYLNLSQMKLGDQVHPQSYLCKVKDPPCCESRKTDYTNLPRHIIVFH